MGIIISALLDPKEIFIPFPHLLSFNERCYIPWLESFSLTLNKDSLIPHMYIILYRDIYLIPVYICLMKGVHIYTLEQVW